MARFKFLSNIVWIVFFLGLFPTDCKELCAPGSDELCHHLASPAEFSLVEVVPQDDKVRMKFSFYISSDLKPITDDNKLQMVLLPPIDFKFEKEVESFETFPSYKDPAKVPNDPVVDYYKKLGKELDSRACPKKYVSEILTLMDKRYSSAMGIYTKESSKSYIYQCKYGTIGDSGDLIYLKKDCKELKKGYYMWSGEFSYSKDLGKTNCANQGTNWLLGFIHDGKGLSIDQMTGICINTDAVSANIFFEKIGYLKAVLACHGKRIPLHDFIKPKYSSHWSVDTKYTITSLKQKKLDLSYYFILYPDLKEWLNSRHILRIKFLGAPYSETLFSGDLTEKIKVSEPKSSRTAVTYDASTQTVSVQFKGPVAKSYEDYKLHIYLDELYDKHPEIREISFAIDIPGPEPSMDQSHQLQSRLVSQQKSFVKTERDKKTDTCQSLVKEMYSKTLELRQLRYRRIAEAGPFKIYPLAYPKPLYGYVSRSSPGKYLLSLNIDKDLVSVDDGGMVSVELPKSVVSYDARYFDGAATTDADIGDSLHYDPVSHSVTVRLRSISLDKKSHGSYEGYVVPIPFTSSVPYKTLMDEKQWLAAIYKKDVLAGYTLISIQSSSDFSDSDQRYVKKQGGDGYVRGIHYLPANTKTKFVVTVHTSVYRDMLFTFTFAKKVIEEKRCNVSVVDKASLFAKTLCSKDGTKIAFYLQNADYYVGKKESLTFFLELDSSVLEIKGYGDVTISAVVSDAPIVQLKDIDLSKGFDDLKTGKFSIFQEHIALKDVKDASTSPSACIVYTNRPLTVNFKDHSRAVYYLTRVQDCDKPWLPPHGFDESDAFSLELASGKDMASGHSTIQEVYRLKSLYAEPSYAEVLAMKSKQFAEHTLYILFTKETMELLITSVPSLRLCYAGLDCIEKFLTDIPDKQYPNIFGDIKYAYYDDSRNALHIKRKALFQEDEKIKNDEQKIDGVKSLKSALDYVLDDGFAHVDPESVTESFAVLVFAATREAYNIRFPLKEYVITPELTKSMSKLKHSVLVKVYGLDSKPMKVSGTGCVYTSPAVSLEPIKTLAKGKMTKFHFLNPDTPMASSEKMYYVYKFGGVAKKITDNKMPPGRGSLKGLTSSNERTPERDSFDVFLQLLTQDVYSCTQLGSKVDTFTKLVYDFMGQVRETLARQNLIVASCVKFDDAKGAESPDTKYNLVHMGMTLRAVMAPTLLPKAGTTEVDGTCNISTLYENMPRTLHYDPEFKYKRDLKEEIEKPVLKSGADIEKMLLSKQK
ncbi:uncharacterized protein BXIN_2551 [Babesia sp. Xinjiang]|uniref:uncharacterized protein n=1 Tax=Babesia sp. Xinjiang TaxID=462227 RepID=UPI000A225B91|nr:uncharacterized protein BXIN_2551 [Babesia sp. Xinjiang]ORM41405.1 hypothetical protein BXIN_2551 [Babesia sp. Xinjiang]